MFHVWSLIILLTNTARVKMLSSIMKMQILDQKMQNAGPRAFTIHKWIFLHHCYTSFKIRSLCIFLLGPEYHYGHHKTSFLDIQSKNTKYPGYKVYMSKLFFLWVNRALELDESINNLTIGKFSF